MTRFRNLIILLAACALAFTAQAAGPARQDSKDSKETAAKQAPPTKAEYAGSEACAGCHEDIAKAFARNPHFNLEKNKHWEGKACEACHGMGSKHAESASADDIINPAKQSAAKTDGICLACHRNQSTHVGRIQSGHSRSAIACTSCHDMHKIGADSSFARLKRSARSFFCRKTTSVARRKLRSPLASTRCLAKRQKFGRVTLPRRPAWSAP